MRCAAAESANTKVSRSEYDRIRNTVDSKDKTHLVPKVLNEIIFQYSVPHSYLRIQLLLFLPP